MSTDSLDEAERRAHEALAELRREYERRAAPYIDILCRVHAMRPPEPIFIPIDVAQKFGLMPKSPAK